MTATNATAYPRLCRAVCVHGAGGGGWEWAIWQRVFAAHGVDVCAPDLAPIAAGVEATRLADYSAQVETWCAAQTGPYALIGASLGGLLALAACATQAPAALVLINPLTPAGIAPQPAPKAYPARVRWGSARRLGSTLRAMPDADDAARLFAWRRWRDESGAVLAAAHALDVAPPRCPTLLLASTQDRDVPLASSRALACAWDFDLMLCRDAGHVGPLLGRGAAACAARALAWLATV